MDLEVPETGEECNIIGGLRGKMVEYNIVKFCRLCRARFVVGKSEAKRQFCAVCQKKTLTEDKEEVGGKTK